MVGTQKILTVSYGTFSCTLEGFDDSFDTMKAIAEYFRDLAADDRYFGAEPPQPDAEMLARIAEREIARRVEAVEQDGAFHLRAASLAAPAAAEATTDDAADPAATPAPDAPDAPETSADAPAPVTAEAPADPPAARPEPAAPALETAPETPVIASTESSVSALLGGAPATPVPAPATPVEAPAATAPAPTATAPAQDATGASVADKLRRIRAVVGQGVPAANGFEEDEHAEDFLREGARDIDDILRTDEVAEDDTADAAIASDVLDALAAADEAEEDGDLRDEPVTEEAEQHGPGLRDGTDTPAVEADSAAEEPVAEDPVAQDPAQEEPATEEPFAEEPEAEAPVAAEMAEDDGADDSFVADAGDEDEDAAVAEEPAAAARARVLRVKRADFDRAVASGEIEETDDSPLSAEEEAELQAELAAVEAELEDETDEDETASLWAEDDEDEDEDDAGATRVADAAWDFEDDEDDEWEDELPADTPVAAQGQAVAEDDADEGDEDGWDYEIDGEDEEDEAAAAPATHADTLRGPMDEDALSRNLAAVMADADLPRDADGDGDDEDDGDEAKGSGLAASIRDMARRTVRMGSGARERLTSRPLEDDSEAVDRLMDQAEGRLDEPQGQTRRNAIQHLRAAVAATKAEQEARGSDETDGDEAEPYRGDLAEHVRPRRPAASGERSDRPQRPEPARAAPLKLVAEQRVDLPRGEPIRPRRVGQDLAAMAEDASGFAEFAENTGAHTLPELLEAAAAYMSYVEGRDEFSRPQLMTAVRAVSDSAFSREDGLRYFGQLLREGKIAKIEGGRFVAAEGNEYRPDTRAAG